MGHFKARFNNAAVSHDPDVLAQIALPQLNLAVWRRAAEPLRRSAYLRNLDLETLGDGLEWRHGYHKALFTHDVPLNPSTKALRANLNLADQRLEDAGFPAGRPEDGLTRRALAGKMIDFTRHFADAIGAASGFSVLTFRPDAGMFWHTDNGPARGIVTLRGDDATLWRPDQSLPAGKPRGSTYWGAVLPDRQRYIQTLEPGDMAIFKCRDHENPLVHASPLCSKTRLVMIMGPG